ncbi:hypothetical protein RvY_08489 [Ramazzottius varieornatus]|uniref:G-protein coupled receptors family 1 profile domain-containing protein n=1 Tax=Ramazzottius varieornatus TaxID=947166 RepID=A0A1D1VBL2_RAMVA|nr:hypothetical protein RvY_08489 [Ramazzottius varieornatus]
MDPNSTNSTEDLTSDPHWSSTSWLSLFIMVAGFLTNGSVLALYVLQPSLCSPFAIYMINLFIANLIEIALRYPIDLVNELHGRWWTSWSSCTVSLYCVYVVQGAMYNAHAVIALNRLWAIACPRSYHQKHTRKYAITVCVSMWIYLHIFLLPGVVSDAMYYRPTLTAGYNQKFGDRETERGSSGQEPWLSDFDVDDVLCLDLLWAPDGIFH